MNIILHPWTSLKQTWPIRKSEWILSLGTVALWVLFSVRTNLFEMGGYEGLERWAPQQFWTWMLFVIGWGRLIVLFVNGAYWRSPHWRAALAFLNSFIWYQLMSGLAQDAGIALVLAGVVFIVDIMNFRQAFIEAAASEGLKGGERKRLRANP